MEIVFRVATAQGKQRKQGIWFLLFPDRENTGNFVVTQGKIWKHRENILTVIINIKSMFIFLNFKNFSLASLGIIVDSTILCMFVPTCYMSPFYLCVYPMSKYIHA